MPVFRRFYNSIRGYKQSDKIILTGKLFTYCGLVLPLNEKEAFDISLVFFLQTEEAQPSKRGPKALLLALQTATCHSKNILQHYWLQRTVAESIPPTPLCFHFLMDAPNPQNTVGMDETRFEKWLIYYPNGANRFLPAEWRLYQILLFTQDIFHPKDPPQIK